MGEQSNFEGNVAFKMKEVISQPEATTKKILMPHFHILSGGKQKKVPLADINAQTIICSGILSSIEIPSHLELGMIPPILEQRTETYFALVPDNLRILNSDHRYARLICTNMYQNFKERIYFI